MKWVWGLFAGGRMVEWSNTDDWDGEPLVRFFNDELWIKLDTQSILLPKNWEICT
jgi:hypothetical protein